MAASIDRYRQCNNARDFPHAGFLTCDRPEVKIMPEKTKGETFRWHLFGISVEKENIVFWRARKVDATHNSKE